jgi:predicted small lipoprotein YifL
MNETNGMTRWAWARFWLALVALVGLAAGCKGPLYVHEEHYHSIIGVQTRHNTPDIASDNVGAVGAMFKGNSVLSNNKAQAGKNK